MGLLRLSESYTANYTRISDGLQVLAPVSFAQTNDTFNDAGGSEIQGPLVPGAVNVDLTAFTGSVAQYMLVESADPFSIAFSGLAAPGIAATTRILVEGTVSAAAASTAVIITTTTPSQIFRTRLMAA